MANPLTWLLAPVHLLALLGPAKSFRDNPVLGSPGLNRAGLHILRKRLALRSGARRRASLSHLLPRPEREAFERDGFLVLPDFLPPAEFAALKAEILNLSTAAREFVDGYTMTRLIPLDETNLRHLPASRRVLLGSRYQALHAFIGSHRQRPHLFVQSIFSGVRAAPVAGQRRLVPRRQAERGERRARPLQPARERERRGRRLGALDPDADRGGGLGHRPADIGRDLLHQR
jgi:hypothetical protein